VHRVAANWKVTLDTFDVHHAVGQTGLGEQFAEPRLTAARPGWNGRALTCA
jgi:hypothetical protein